jgi:phage repressor protein C with HTH and peptisase S24 domain
MEPDQGRQHAASGGRPIVAWETPDDLGSDDYVLVSRVDVRPSAGEGALVFEEEEGPPLAFSAQWIKEQGLKRRNLLTVKAQGDSMEPSIHDGDTIMIDSGFEQVVDGQVYVIRYGDELKVKRLYQRYDGALIIRSDNEAKYPAETVPPDANGRVSVIGRVVWRAGGVN